MGESIPTCHAADLTRIRELIDLFDPVARQAQARPICWISDGDDCGTDFCPDCARWKAKHLRRSRKYPEAFADGGWDNHRQSDVTSFCGGCGHILSYSLSSHAYGEELDHWSGDAWSEAMTPVHAFQIRAVLDAACVYREFVAEAVAIGERAAALLPAQTPHPEPSR